MIGSVQHNLEQQKWKQVKATGITSQTSGSNLETNAFSDVNEGAPESLCEECEELC